MPQSSLRLLPRTRCPACAGDALRELFSAPLLGIPTPVMECRACGLVFKASLPDENALASIYGEGYTHFQAAGPLSPGELNSAAAKLQRCMSLLDGAPSRGQLTVLDYGCGSGRFVSALQKLGVHARGFDPYSSYGRHGDGSGRSDMMKAGSYDVVFMLNVLEHVTEPVPHLVEAAKLLRPGGVLLLTCPYGGSLARRLYRDRWQHLALDEHLTFWNRRSLELLARRAGFAGRAWSRVGGPPFPFGKAVERRPAAAPAPNSGASKPRHRAWKLAVKLQGSRWVYRAMTTLVAGTRTGDYIEFAVAK